MNARSAAATACAAACLAACVQTSSVRPPAAQVLTSIAPPDLPAVQPVVVDPRIIDEEAQARRRTLAETAAYRWRIENLSTSALAAAGTMRVTGRVSEGVSSADMDVIVFDSRQCALRVIDQPHAYAGGGEIATSMREINAVGGVNGGYFTPEFRPLGLMVSHGKPTGSLVTSTLLGGLIVSTGGSPRLLWRSEYSHAAATTDLVQAGPRLVDESRPLPKLDRSKSRPRTFIATDGGHGWAVGVVKSTSLGELAEMLATPGVLPGLRVQRALNLDGGRSSAIWMRTAAGEEISEPGWSTVRNFIAIVPR